ncbi:MAG: hypothetical protein HY922_03235 [Elusimicrobia bacterium]|nr:hypothetical protein [Elusimicrobiota bacterium]
MMLRRAFVPAASALVFAFLTTPSLPQRSCQGFLPPNDMKIPVNSKDAKGITQAQFDQVMDSAQAIYGPVVEARGGVLEINRRWDDPTVNASAQRIGNRYILNMYGGLARHEVVTQDGFALVVCHELGHHIGGFPKMKYSGWATNEGQSDYFANLKCLRRVFADSASLSFTRAAGSDPVAEKACAQSFNGSERAACMRGAMAGKSVSALFKTLHNESKDPLFDTPDPNVVPQTSDSHPATQCRLDTYFQGSLCAKPVSEDVSDKNPAPGTCTRSQGFSAGLRPLCWYKPPASEPSLTPAEIARFGAPASQARESLSKSGAFSRLGGSAVWRGL